MYAIVMPGSRVRSAFEGWWGERALHKATSESWHELAGTTARLDTVPGTEPLLIKFSDYQCRFCKLAHSGTSALVASEEGITIGLRHFPASSIHPHAEPAAIAAICSEFQGRFPAMNARLFAIDDWSVEPDWQDIARDVGDIDVAEFVECLEGQEAEWRLEGR